MCAAWFVVMVVYSVYRYSRRQRDGDAPFPELEAGKEGDGKSARPSASVGGGPAGCDNAALELQEPK